MQEQMQLLQSERITMNFCGGWVGGGCWHKCHGFFLLPFPIIGTQSNVSACL